MLFVISFALLLQPPACQQAATQFQKGNLAAARTLLDAAKPEGAFCTKLSGLVFAAMGDYRNATQPFSEACKLAPQEPDACYYWARALYSLDRFEDSLLALNQAKPGATKPWKIATARGQALDALGRPQAEAELTKALFQRSKEDTPVTEPDPLLALAAFLYRQGRATEAQKLLEQAPKRYQTLATYHYQLGRALSQQQRWQESAEALRRAVSLDPSSAESHGLLSRAYYRLGQSDLAAHHARRATQGSVISR